MGIGSPRPLTRLIARAAAAAAVALFFAPAAFADGLVPGGLVGGTPAASVPVPVPSTPAALPVAAVNMVAPPTPQPAPTHVASVAATPVASVSNIVESATVPRLATHVATLTKHPQATASSSQRAAAPTPAAHSRTTTPNRPANERLFAHSLASSPATTALPALQARSSHVGPQQNAGSPTAGIRRPQLPQPPAPLPAGAGGAVGGSAGATGFLLLFGLALAAAALAPPGLSRRFRALLAALRPHPFLLRLERPD
jgi:hypothetical protein